MFNALIFVLILGTSFLFAMLGLGGGMVYVPILKWAGLDFKNVVIPLGLLLNGLNTFLALIPYHRNKLVDYKGAWPMGVTAVIFAPLGAMVSVYVPKDTLIILFALFVVLAALKVLWDVRKSEPQGTRVQDDSFTMALNKRKLVGGIVGIFIGFIGGLLGVGGGFIVGPVLMSMGYSTKQAAATTAFVVTFSSFSGYFGYMASGEVFTWLTALLILAVVIGSQLGANFMAKKAKAKWVKISYGVVLLLISVKLVLDVL